MQLRCAILAREHEEASTNTDLLHDYPNCIRHLPEGRHDGTGSRDAKLEAERAGRRRDICGPAVFISHLHRRPFDRLALAIEHPHT